MEPVRVLIVDDEPLARDRIRMALRGDARVEVAGEAEDGAAAVRHGVGQRPGPARIRIRATSAPDMLRLVIEDSGTRAMRSG